MTFVPRNKLEEALIEYCKNNISAYPFYHVLLNSNIFVLLHSNYPSESGAKKTNNYEEIHYHALEISGRLYIPIFSSNERMQKYIESNLIKTSSIEINMRSFLESVNPSHSVLLNYKSDYGKEFTPEEIKLLLGLEFKEMVFENDRNYSGMTVNERLLVSGLMGQFDIAMKDRNKNQIIEILKKIDFEEKAAEQFVNTIFENPEKYGF